MNNLTPLSEIQTLDGIHNPRVLVALAVIIDEFTKANTLVSNKVRDPSNTLQTLTEYYISQAVVDQALSFYQDSLASLDTDLDHPTIYIYASLNPEITHITPYAMVAMWVRLQSRVVAELKVPHTHSVTQQFLLRNRESANLQYPLRSVFNMNSHRVMRALASIVESLEDR